MSACLLGNRVRYDGEHNLIEHAIIQRWQNEGRLVMLCPEVAGGMSVPRLPCEIVSVNPLLILANDGSDQTEYFIQGAKKALALAKQHHIHFAILKQSSPSCGSRFRYDGRFSKTKIPGEGITAQYLRENHITIFDETQIELAQRTIQQYE